MQTSFNKKIIPASKNINFERTDDISEISIPPIPTNPEELSDMLLENAGTLNRRRERHIYTERQLARKIRNEYKRLESQVIYNECDIESDIQSYILESAITQLSELAQLSSLQQIIFTLYVDGLSCRDISILLGKKRKTIWDMIMVSRYKIRRVLNEGKYAGWYEVYLGEVNRISRAKASKNV